jgi:hypothetical protein
LLQPWGSVIGKKWFAGPVAALAAVAVHDVRRDLLKVSGACGVEHPALIDVDRVEFVNACASSVTLRALYGYQPGWGQPDAATCEAIMALMRGTAPRGGSAPSSPTAAD